MAKKRKGYTRVAKKRGEPFKRKADATKYAKHRLNRLLREARLDLLKSLTDAMSRDEVKQGLWNEDVVDEIFASRWAKSLKANT